jgi:RNA polymerase sigma-70 factor (ECF subfamily)
MQDLSDFELLAAFKGGQTRAFELLVDRHQASCLRHAAFLLGGRAEVEDTVQEVFMKLVQRPPDLPNGLDPERQAKVLSAWLHKVTRNACMDALRSETRRVRREEAAALPEGIGGGQEGVEAADTREAVERSLEKLPADQREVLLLRLFGDRSYREIAEATGKKAGTVGWLISTGLRALSVELEPLLGLASSSHSTIQPAQDAQ